MAIVNRDLDGSEQIRNLAAVVSTSVAASAAQSFFVAQAPYPALLKTITVAPNTISGSPVVSASVKRFTSAGATTIPVGSTLTLTAHGLSAAYQNVPLIYSGASTVQLLAGDVIVLNQEFSGGNVAAGNAVVSVGVKALQDIKEEFGTVN